MNLIKRSKTSESPQTHYLVQEYRRWNNCIGGVLFFLLLFMTAAVYLLQKPCPFLQRTGHPCLLCGCTRDFLLILRGRYAVYNTISFPLFIGLLLEFCWRLAICFVPDKILKKCLFCDIAWHVFWGISLALSLTFR